MTDIGRQGGLTLWGYLIILMAIVALATVVLRLGPHYMTHNTVTAVIEGMTPAQVHGMSKRALHDQIEKGFTINSIYDLDSDDILSIDRTRERTVLIVDYEVREHLVYNIDVMLSFHDEYQFQ